MRDSALNINSIYSKLEMGFLRFMCMVTTEFCALEIR